jgi:hypothetical protein
MGDYGIDIVSSSSIHHDVSIVLTGGDNSTEEVRVDRRIFVRNLFGLAAVAAAGTSLIGQAEAAPIPVTPVEPPQAQPESTTEYRPDVDGEAKPENAQYYIVRRRRRFYRPRYRYYRRRRYYRVYRRPRYRRVIWL